MYIKMSDEVLKAKMSANAKNLYAILLDKYELSAKKGFLNASGEVICKMKQSEMAERLSCSVRTIQRTIEELKQKNLIQIELGLCKMYEIKVFQICQNGSFKTDKMADLELPKCQVYNCQNGSSLTYKPNQQARLTKPNARAQAHMREGFLADEKVGDGILENSKNPSLENSQSPNAKKSSKAFLQMCDKPEFISTECWQDFITYKKQRNERYTDIGKSKFLSHLAQIQANTNACEEALNKSIVNNWQGVFEQKIRANKTSYAQNTSPSQITNVLMDWISDDEAIIAECEETLALPSRKEA